jgi:hypothetical protein
MTADDDDVPPMNEGTKVRRSAWRPQLQTRAGVVPKLFGTGVTELGLCLEQRHGEGRPIVGRSGRRRWSNQEDDSGANRSVRVPRPERLDVGRHLALRVPGARSGVTEPAVSPGPPAEVALAFHTSAPVSRCGTHDSEDVLRRG